MASSSHGSSEPDPSSMKNIWRVTATIVGQTMQVVVANAALILMPALLVPGAFSHHRLWLLFTAYVAFFVLGTIKRIVKHGALAPRAKDKQMKDLKSKLYLIFFILTMPVLHWLPVLFYLRDTAPHSSLFRYYKGGFLPPEAQSFLDLLGTALIVSAIALNFLAANHLGSSYDRLVAPTSLVTHGPYRHIRHPIYTSYGLLFSGFALTLHSLPCAALLILVCLIYYQQRTRIEEELLLDTFGQQYAEYRRKTQHMFIPLVF